MKPAELLAKIRVVLCRPSHPGNIGAAARAMKNMGLSSLYLVTPRQFPDPRPTPGPPTPSTSWPPPGSVPAWTRLWPAPPWCGAFRPALGIRAATLGRARGGGRPALPPPPGGEVALVFGNETTGLSNEEVPALPRRGDHSRQPGIQFPNLGRRCRCCVTNCAWGLRRHAAQRRPDYPRLPAAGHPRRGRGFYAHLERVMTDAGFYNPAQPGRLFPSCAGCSGVSAWKRTKSTSCGAFLAATQEKTGLRPPRLTTGGRSGQGGVYRMAWVSMSSSRWP